MQVPVVGMGTWKTFDVRDAAAKSNARAVVDTALSAGAHFFDSSPMYGEAEHVLGETLLGRRNSAMIATKVWANSVSEGQAQVKRALTFFDNFIDLYQIHNLVLWQEHLNMLEQFQQRGRVAAPFVNVTLKIDAFAFNRVSFHLVIFIPSSIDA